MYQDDWESLRKLFSDKRFKICKIRHNEFQVNYMQILFYYSTFSIKFFQQSSLKVVSLSWDNEVRSKNYVKRLEIKSGKMLCEQENSMLQHFRRVSVLNLEEFLWKVTSQKGQILLWYSDTYFLIFDSNFYDENNFVLWPHLSYFNPLQLRSFSHKMNIYELRNDIPPSVYEIIIHPSIEY